MPLSETIQYSANKCEPLFPIEGGMSELRFAPNQVIAAGTILGQISSASAAEVQTLNFSADGDVPTGGTFTLSITGIDGGTFTSEDIDYDASNAEVKAAVEALLEAAGYAGATVAVTSAGSAACPVDQVVTFGGTALYVDMPLMTADDSALTSAGTADLTVDATTGGRLLGSWVAYDDDGTDDGRRIARAIAVYDFRTDNYGRVVFGAAGTSPEFGVYHTTAPAWFKGRFATTDLVGLDANGAADLGRIESGTVTDGVLALI